MSFSEDFARWLDGSLPSELPREISAFSFNLFEQSKEGSKFGIELVGAGEFDENDPDWACAEVWEPSQSRNFDIPESFCSDGWEDCLSKTAQIIRTILDSDNRLAATLKSVEGVALGFVDGDLHIIHTNR